MSAGEDDGKQAEPDPTEREVLWRQYALHYDVYKFHMDATVKFATLVFAITGVTLGYYLKELQGRPDAKWVLLPALAVNLLFAAGCAVGGSLVPRRKRDVDRIAGLLKLGAPPDLTLLRVVLYLAGAAHGVCVLGLAFLFLR
jgi:hypothetical protein